MGTYKEENSALLKSLLSRTFFRSWKKTDEGRQPWEHNWSGVELIVTPDCNLDCSYCYINNYKDQLYPKGIRKRNIIVKNAEIFIDWLIENDYCPSVDIFSGELFAQKVGFDVLDMIYEKYKDREKKISEICIPTNFSFLLSEEITAKVEAILTKFREIEVPVYLSASVDGKLIEDVNRPMKFNTDMMRVAEFTKDDAFYDKLFAFNKKWGFGFHPMVFAGSVEKWIDNFLWFQENFVKYNISPDSIYLLEVRNAEWTEEQMMHLYRFIRFLIEWTFVTICGKDTDMFQKFILQGRGYNIIGSHISQIGRGIGCSLQSQVYVRLGDLAIVPCHRTMYDGNNYGKFVVEDGKITDIEADNVEMAVGVLSFSAKSQPMCETCAIKHVCSHGCIGAQFEATGDLFTPIPTVCKMEHYRAKAIQDGFEAIGIGSRLYNLVGDTKRANIDNIRKIGGQSNG